MCSVPSSLGKSLPEVASQIFATCRAALLSIRGVFFLLSHVKSELRSCGVRNLDCFQFGRLRPHVVRNRARGKDVQVSRARAHFYVCCKKIGSLWNYTDWWPFLDYDVNPNWVTLFPSLAPFLEQFDFATSYTLYKVRVKPPRPRLSRACSSSLSW